jgi:phosphatidylserine decarboxylase
VSKTLRDWIEQDVAPVRDKPVSWLSQHYFFRDPSRPLFSDSSYFFAPADGIILYQKVVEPGDPLVEIKGRLYSLRDAIRDNDYDKPSLVIGIFMTFFDVHVNRIPYRGRLSYRQLDPIDSHNYPMLDVEKAILDELRIDVEAARYLHNNERMLNTIASPEIRLVYQLLQIADYDVDCIAHFDQKQNRPVEQNAPFSQVRFGSQVDLVLPVVPHLEYVTTQEEGVHVEAGIDTLVRLKTAH